jgi:archaellum biogenesis ATPase FlaH
LKEYNKDIQKLFLEMMINDAESFVRVQNIYKVANFDVSLQATAEMIDNHSSEHGVLPTLEQVNAVTNANLNPVPELNSGHYDWFLDEFESFTKRQELERAILESADLLEKGDFDPVEKLIKDAVQISLTKDMGTDYFADPRARLLAIKDNNGQTSTGWPMLDKKLYGGFNRGELQIFAGGSGSGKSLFMQNLMVNWVRDGKNCVFITLELSEDLCSMRMDSMMTDTASSRIFKELDNVEMKVKMLAKKSGSLRIKYMHAQSTVNDIRSYAKELEIQHNVKVDCMCIDYLDLLMPVSTKVSPSDLFVKDKYVSEEIRNLAKELDIIMVTASQLNRSAVEEIEFDHSHISGGISKINTADNVFGIFTSRAMRERGRYQLQLMKTRSSSGVGQKVELEFDMNTLRITDTGLDPDESASSSSEIMNKMKIGVASSVSSNRPMPKVSGDIKSAKLQSMLNSIKSK